MKKEKRTEWVIPFSTLEIANLSRNALTRIHLARLWLPKIANINEMWDTCVGLQANTVLVWQLLSRTVLLSTF